jgi:hypothetical protein
MGLMAGGNLHHVHNDGCRFCPILPLPQSSHKNSPSQIRPEIKTTALIHGRFKKAYIKHSLKRYFSGAWQPHTYHFRKCKKVEWLRPMIAKKFKLGFAIPIPNDRAFIPKNKGIGTYLTSLTQPYCQEDRPKV